MQGDQFLMPFLPANFAADLKVRLKVKLVVGVCVLWKEALDFPGLCSGDSKDQLCLRLWAGRLPSCLLFMVSERKHGRRETERAGLFLFTKNSPLSPMKRHSLHSRSGKAAKVSIP